MADDKDDPREVDTEADDEEIEDLAPAEGEATSVKGGAQNIALTG